LQSRQRDAVYTPKADFQLVLHPDDTAADFDRLNAKLRLLDANRANIGVFLPSDVDADRLCDPMQGQVARHHPYKGARSPDLD
jgi:hypothetical protein